MKNTPNTIIIDGVEYVPKVEEKKPTGRRTNDTYWHVYADGSAMWKHDNGEVVDDWNWDSGNYYATEEEAKHAKKRQLAQARFERRVKELNDGWEPVWGGKVENWCLGYDHDEKSTYVGFQSHHQEQPKEWRVKSRELAEQLRDECGDDYKIMIGAV